MISRLLQILGLLLLLFVATCGANNTSAPSTTSQQPIAIEGYVAIGGNVQKGPFILGSTVFIQELDSSFNPTGDTYITQTEDDLGSFSLESVLDEPFVEIISQGYYFNEVSGALSDSILTLRTLSQVSDTSATTSDLATAGKTGVSGSASATESTVNINLLTTLSKKRIEYLISNSGLEYADALSKAEEEMLKIFTITSADIGDAGGVSHFDQMDISKTGDSNAALLAASVALQGDNTVGELQELIAKIITGVEENGTLDTTKYAAEIDEIKTNEMNLSLSEVRSNLGDRYSELLLPDLMTTIPKFEDFIDSDGNGIINKNDDDTHDDTHIWARALPYAPTATNIGPWGLLVGPAVELFKNELWLIGGSRSVNGVPTAWNSVWHSSDGKDWALATSSPGWNSKSVLSTVYNDEIWIAVSVDAGTVKGEVWHSSNGIDWTKASDLTRSDVLATVSCGVNCIASIGMVKFLTFNNQLWIFTMKEAWSSSNGITWTKVGTIPIGTSYYIGGFDVTVYNYQGQDYMWLVGGAAAGISDKTMADDVWRSSDGSSWELVTGSAAGGGRQAHRLCVFEDKMWIIGGVAVTGAQTSYSGDVLFSSDGINWSQPADVAHFVDARGSYRCAVTSFGGINKMWAVVSNSDSALTEIWYYTKYSDYSP